LFLTELFESDKNEQGMRKLFILYIILLSTTLTTAQEKRGLAYGYHSPEDLEVLSPNVSWWYNWSEKPENSVINVFPDYGFEFVPMTWNGYFDSVKLVTFLTEHPETKYLLAFNEPNFVSQANMTPSEVAAVWPKLESIADEYNLEIVGPAVNFCNVCVEENGTIYYSPFDYLDDFFAACPDCRVDYIAVHSYMNTISALEWYINEFKSYGKPIWLTEFAGWESNGVINNISDQINYMIGAVDFLEYDTCVFKYSWFIGRGSGINNYPYIDILGANGELTELGQVYTQMPVHDKNMVVDLPARIQAEAYNEMSGILLEKTDDETGFANVGYIDAGDWLEYKINVPADTNLPILLRVASTKNCELDILIDGEKILTQQFYNTGGWQNWETFENSITLPQGEHTIRLYAPINGFNINWFDLGDVASIRFTDDEAFKIFPNPTKDVLHISTTVSENCKVYIMDMMGKLIIYEEITGTGIVNLSKLKKGFYVIKIQQEENYLSRRIIKI